MKKIGAYVQISPIFLWMTVFAVIPLLYVFTLGFVETTPTGGILLHFTLDNYKRIFQPVYLKIFVLSIETALATSCIALLIGYPFAYFTYFGFKRYRNLIVLLVIIPFWTSSLLRAYGFIILFRGNGLVNTLLLHLGIIHEPLKLLYTYPSILVGMVYMLLPFMVLPIYHSIQQLDYSLVEAARDLGASRFRAFLSVTVPLTMTGIFGGVSLVFIPAMGLFFISDLLGGAKIMLLGNLVQNQILVVRNYSFGGALSVMMFFCVLFFIFMCKRVWKEGGLYH